MMTKESPGIIGFVGCPNSPQNTLCSLQFHSALHAIVSTFYRHVGKGLLYICESDAQIIFQTFACTLLDILPFVWL